MEEKPEQTVGMRAHVSKLRRWTSFTVCDEARYGDETDASGVHGAG